MARMTAAFLSYHREVDALGDVTRFRKALEQGVRERGWDDFAVFQDFEDIQWGDDWRDRVLTSLDDVLLLLVVISPGLFQSGPCRLEVSTFLQREAQSPGRGRIVLPVYFVTTPAYDSGSPDPEGLVSKLHDRNFLDFRDLRIRGTDDREYRQAILKAAARVADLLTASAALVSAPTPPTTIEEPARREATSPPEVVLTTPRDGPGLLDIGRKRRRLNKWVWLGPAILIGIPAILLPLHFFPPGSPSAVTKPEAPLMPEQISPIIAPAEPPAREPVLKPVHTACLIQRATQTYRQPKTGAAFGPYFSPGEEIQLAGQVDGSDWLAARESEGQVVYFEASACQP